MNIIWILLKSLFTIVFSILNLLPSIFSIPTTLPELIQFQIESTFVLSSIEWINKSLYVIATIISIVFSYLVTRELDVSKKFKSFVTLAAYCITALLFSYLWFWITFGVLFIVSIILIVYIHNNQYT